jgi:heme-degrading monooxygenase HmoA
MSYVILWTYDVAPEHAAAFRGAYGPAGDWAQLFARAPGFIGAELYAEADRYLTIDRWESAACFEAFQAEHAAAYRALDAKLAHLSRSQARLGAFTAA